MCNFTLVIRNKLTKQLEIMTNLNTNEIKATEQFCMQLCYYCESEHTRKNSSYCCNGCEKAQQKQEEFDNN